MRDGAIAVQRRRSRAERNRLVCEYEQSGLGRKEFCAAHGLSVHTLDFWRRSMVSTDTREKIVPVEIVEDHVTSRDTRPAASVAREGYFRIVLADGLRIEIDPGFDAVELRRLLVVLDRAV